MGDPLTFTNFKISILGALFFLVLGLCLGFWLRGIQADHKSNWISITGCGLNSKFKATPERQLVLHDLLKRLQPIPPMVNGALVKSASGDYYCWLSEVSDTNGIGRLPLFGGERIILVHRDN